MDAATDHGDRAPRRAALSYLFGPFRVDVATHQLFRGDELVPLTHKAFDTLLVLVKHRDRLVTKDELMSLVWPKSFVSDDSLAQSISVLRRTLGDHSSQPEFIATIPRRGYRFVAPVTEIPNESEAAADAAPSQADVAAPANAPVPASPVAASHESGVSIPATAHGRGEAPGSTRTSRWILGAAAVASVLALALIGRTLIASRPPEPGGAPIRFAQYPPEGTRLMLGGVLSPDGTHLAFVAQDERTGKNQMWVRSLDATEPRALDGTQDAIRPFWSPDSQSIGFFANYQLRRITLTGDPPTTIADVGANPAGASWGDNGIILFSVRRSGLFSVPAVGGTVTEVTTLDASAQEVAHSAPQFLPDGEQYLFVLTSSNPDRGGTYIGRLGSNDRTRLTDRPAVYAPPGYLLYVRDRALIAHRFNPSGSVLQGDPITVAGNVDSSALSASARGLLAFGGTATAGRLSWFNRTGERMGTINAPTDLHSPQMLRSQRQIVASGGNSVWLVDLDRGAATRLWPGSGAPTSSPDGGQIVFTSDRQSGVADMYVRSTTGRNDDEPLVKTKEAKTVTDWSRDGRYIVFTSLHPRSKNDLWLLPRFGDGRPTLFIQTPYNEIQGVVSPDGRWIAYASDESGAWEVYVQSFPVPGSKRMVSVGGGAQPQWLANGRELFYLASDRRLMSVEISPGEIWDAGRPMPLFRAPVLGSLGDIRNHYVVSNDGSRFLIDSVRDDGQRESITVVVNWTSLLKP